MLLLRPTVSNTENTKYICAKLVDYPPLKSHFFTSYFYSKVADRGLFIGQFEGTKKLIGQFMGTKAAD